MKFEVRGRGVEVTEEWTLRAARRVAFAFDRFGRRLAAISVLLQDRNGPKGGVDKHCSVVVRGVRGWEIRGSADSDDIGAAIDAAVERAARAVTRHLERRGEMHDRASAAEVSGESPRPCRR